MHGSPIRLPASQIVGGVKIEKGSYVGTGTYGPSNPNVLTFDFNPQIIVFFGRATETGFGNSPYSANLLWGIATGLTNHTVSSANNTISYSSNTMQWYSSYSADGQFNYDKIIYRYVAIG